MFARRSPPLKWAIWTPFSAAAFYPPLFVHSGFVHSGDNGVLRLPNGP